MSEWVLEVSEVNEYVRQLLQNEPALRKVRLRGEISNFKRHSSGHWYFTLKDERCRIAAVMFRQNAMRMSIRPMDGMSVIVSGQVGLYSEGGSYQITCDSMRPDGIGTLYQQFEALKKRLAAEGLFDEEHKRRLPYRPKKIAVVTSETGAVLHDICMVSRARDPGVPLVLVPVQVQGAGAAESIAQGIRRAAKIPEVEVVIVGRGGGSMEDLWAFNEEIVARAIYDCPIPVISAVGHETDFTIADFVADRRAATPSNAAEMTGLAGDSRGAGWNAAALADGAFAALAGNASGADDAGKAAGGVRPEPTLDGAGEAARRRKNAAGASNVAADFGADPAIGDGADSAGRRGGAEFAAENGAAASAEAAFAGAEPGGGAGARLCAGAGRRQGAA